MKTLLFDFDGTLVDSRDIVVQIYNGIADKYSYRKIDSSDISTLSKISITERCKFLNVPTYKIPLLVYEAMKIYKDYILDINILEEMKDVLSELKKEELNLVIVSSNSKSTIKAILQRNKVDIFNYIYSSKNLFGKHFTIDTFIKKHNIKREEVIYIGDEQRDIISCKKCGIKIISVTWGYDSSDLLLAHKPDYIVNKPIEIIDIVKFFKKE
ncbi:MAG: HAD-IA family hydrolase [Bacillota bacterium]